MSVSIVESSSSSIAAGSGVTAIGLTLKLSSRNADGSMLIDGSGSNISVFVLVLSNTSLSNISIVDKLKAAGCGSINVFFDVSKFAVVEVHGIEMVTAGIAFAVVGSILDLVEVVTVVVVVGVVVVEDEDEVVVVEGGHCNSQFVCMFPSTNFDPL